MSGGSTAAGGRWIADLVSRLTIGFGEVPQGPSVPGWRRPRGLADDGSRQAGIALVARTVRKAKAKTASLPAAGWRPVRPGRSTEERARPLELDPERAGRGDRRPMPSSTSAPTRSASSSTTSSAARRCRASTRSPCAVSATASAQTGAIAAGRFPPHGRGGAPLPRHRRRDGRRPHRRDRHRGDPPGHATARTWSRRSREAGSRCAS